MAMIIEVKSNAFQSSFYFIFFSLENHKIRSTVIHREMERLYQTS